MAVTSSALGILSSAFSFATGLKLSTSGLVGESEDELPSPTLSALSSNVIKRFNPFTPIGAPGIGHATAYKSSPAATLQTKLEAVDLTGKDVQPEVIELTVEDLFGVTYGMMLQPPPTSSLDDDDTVLTVHVHLLKTHMWETVKIKLNSTVKELRQEAALKLGLLPARLMLIFDNTKLEDQQLIKYEGIAPICLLFGLECTPAQMKAIFTLDPKSLAPEFDYDLTDEKDDGKTYQRGNFTYTRPYGWKRCAVRVLGKYEDDKWLGADGIRTESTDGEWPVSYHGTADDSVAGIINNEYHKGHGSYHRFERGVYTSPALKEVDGPKGYATTFTHERKQYRLVLQNRVNPAPGHLIIHGPEETGHKDFPYWVSPLQNQADKVFDVRPYGILLREL